MADSVPTARELEALKILWSRGRATVREIFQELKPRETELAYTTALSLLQTMEQKGLVGHESAGKAYAYYAKVKKGDVFRRLAGGFLDQVFDGAMGEYVARALQSRRLSLKELEEIEAMIADAKKKAQGRDEKGGKS
jgi:BlaI family transcriptional regulator, penicillinase repressor